MQSAKNEKSLYFFFHELEKMPNFSLFKKNKQKLLLFRHKTHEAPSIDEMEKQYVLRQKVRKLSKAVEEYD